MKRIALFGGSFNPPHAGHAAILHWLIERNPCKLDDIWVLPVVDHAFSKDLAPYEDREILVKAMIFDLVRDPKLRQGEGSWAHQPNPFRPTLPVVRRDEKYTVDTLRALHAENPDTEFVLVIGSDCYADRKSWKDWDAIETLAEVVTVGRPGYDSPEGTPKVGGQAISSTSIRERLANQDLSYLIGEGADLSFRVLREIQKRGLYGWKPDEPDEDEVRIGFVRIPLQDLLACGPAKPFHLMGSVRQVLGVGFEPTGTSIGASYSHRDHIVFEVLFDTRMLREHSKQVESWMRKQTEARHLGKEFTDRQPTLKGPALQYLRVDEPTKGHIEKGVYLGKAGKYAFWQVQSEDNGFRSLFSGLFG